MSLTSILEQSAEEITRPPNLPPGHYRLKIPRAHNQSETESGWIILTIPCQVQAAQADVDETALEDFGRSLDSVILSKNFFFKDESLEGAAGANKNARWQVKEFLIKCGVEVSGSLNDMLKASIGAEFIGRISEDPRRNDPDVLENNLRTAISLGSWDDYV